MLSFVSGAVAGASGTVASYPFDLLRTTLAAQGKPPVRALPLVTNESYVVQEGRMEKRRQWPPDKHANTISSACNLFSRALNAS